MALSAYSSPMKEHMNEIKRMASKLLLFFICTLLSTVVASAQFGNRQYIDSTISRVNHIISQDINNDGFTDIIVAKQEWQKDNISYYLNTADNQFGPRQTLSSLSQTPNAVAAGDLNNDGWIDVVTITLDRDSSVLWYPNSAGSFPTEILLDIDVISPEDVAIADVDNDTDLDIVVLGHTNIRTYKNDGLGNFVKEITPNTSFEYYDFFIADIDGDQFQDIVIGSGDVLVYKNINGSFSLDTMRTNTITNNGFVFLVALSDLDNDGDADLLIDGNTNREIRWYANDGNGFFMFSQTIEHTIQCKSLAPADIDNDGDEDVMASLYQEGEIVWYENTGNGEFGSKQIIGSSLAAQTTEVHPLDINNDGKIDIAWAHPLSFNLNGDNAYLVETERTEMSIYPNPATETLSIDVKQKGKVKIYNALGQVVQEAVDVNTGQNVLCLNLPPQTYFIQFTSDDGRLGQATFIVR